MTSHMSVAQEAEVSEKVFPKLYLLRTTDELHPAVAKPQLDRWTYTVSKRFIDVAVSTVSLVLLAPVMVIIALVVNFTSPGPIIFRQVRLTEGGRRFMLYKFRTMRVDAEQLSGPVFASQNDPRITSLGRFLRKTRLDEIPQLWNVLQGDMSLVGPRPERPEMATKLASSIPKFGKRLGAKAGITGLAQVKVGYPDGIEGYRKKLALDLVYIKHQSIFLDFWIAFRTLGVIVTGSGAR